MSVKIVDFKQRESFEGKVFFALVLQGGVSVVKSENGNSYVTIRKASLPTTFDEATCQSLIGTDLPGTIEKVPCAPYEYTMPETGEVVTLEHTFQYTEDEMPNVDFTKIVKHSSNGVKAEIA